MLLNKRCDLKFWFNIISKIKGEKRSWDALYFLVPIPTCIYLFVSDMIKRRNLRTRSIKMLVLDEADEMLNKGFKEQIYDVYRYLPPAIQVPFLNISFINLLFR